MVHWPYPPDRPRTRHLAHVEHRMFGRIIEHRESRNQPSFTTRGLVSSARVHDFTCEDPTRGRRRLHGTVTRPEVRRDARSTLSGRRQKSLVECQLTNSVRGHCKTSERFSRASSKQCPDRETATVWTCHLQNGGDTLNHCRSVLALLSTTAGDQDEKTEELGSGRRETETRLRESQPAPADQDTVTRKAPAGAWGVRSFAHRPAFLALPRSIDEHSILASGRYCDHSSPFWDRPPGRKIAIQP